MAFWQDIGRALRNAVNAIIHPERPPEPAPPEEEEPYEPIFGGYPEEPEEYPQGGFGGDFFGPPEPQYEEPADLPEGPFAYQEGMGPYLDEWGDKEIAFWDRVADGQTFEDAEQYQSAMDAFDNGWIRPTDDDFSAADRNDWRDEFLDEMDMIDFDWAAFREYYE